MADPPASTRAGRIGADEAARRLGVRRDTLYAYVSRGLVRSERQAGTRERLYHAEDVEQLLDRKRGRTAPAKAAAEALHFGAPILASELTLIADGRLYFRGRPAEALARNTRFEDVAGLLWGRAPELDIPDALPDLPADWDRLRALTRALPPIERFQTLLAATSAADASAHDLSREAIERTGAKILRLLAAAAVDAAPSRDAVARVLQRGWAPRRDAALAPIEAALVLWADHELNVGTFTARCVASAHGTPYGAAIAGLSALRGGLHGGATEQVEALFEEVGEPTRARDVLEARLRRGERIPGFGHSLYPDGDPRARALFEVLRASDAADASPAAWALSDALHRETVRLIGREPNVDFATVTLRRALALPAHSAIALVAVSRSAGWIAHCLEQVTAGRLIRPRARYIGVLPEAGGG